MLKNLILHRKYVLKYFPIFLIKSENLAPIFLIAWHVRKVWKEANQSDFGWEPFVSSYLKIVPIMVLLFLIWLSVCSMSCVQALHINYHQLWQLNSSVGQIKEWLLHVQSLQMSFFSSDLIWILMIRKFSSNILGPHQIHNTWSQRQIYK